MLGGRGLSTSRYGSFFGGRTAIFCWYTYEVAVHGWRGDVDLYIKCGRTRRPRSIPNAILEDTRDICTRDVQPIEQEIFSIKRTTLRGQGYPHFMGAYKDVGMCRPLRIKAKCERRRRLYEAERNFSLRIGGKEERPTKDPGSGSNPPSVP